MPSISSSIDDFHGLDDGDLLNSAIEAYYADIAKAVGRRSPARTGALDIVHDLYVKLAENPEVLRDKRSIKAFLCRAAVNLGIDRYRREAFEATIFSSMGEEVTELPATAALAPDRGLEIKARIAVLRDAIGELPPRRRVVFVLHRLDDMPPEEIARKLGISRNMVDRHLRRAFAHCLDRLLQMQ
ncbi:sigma-70 family RNA polymerase sigma factor [Nisaea sp.]